MSKFYKANRKAIKIKGNSKEKISFSSCTALSIFFHLYNIRANNLSIYKNKTLGYVSIVTQKIL